MGRRPFKVKYRSVGTYIERDRVIGEDGIGRVVERREIRYSKWTEDTLWGTWGESVGAVIALKKRLEKESAAVWQVRIFYKGMIQEEDPNGNRSDVERDPRGNDGGAKR
jgi:hypothetical protein